MTTQQAERQLIADLLSALEYHTEQTRPIEFSKVAIEAASEYLRKPAQQPCKHSRTIGDGSPENEFCYDCNKFINRTALAEQPANQEPFTKEHEFVQWGVSKYGPLLKAAIDLLAEVDANLESKDVPQKFGVPFGKLNALRGALTAAPQAQPAREWVGLTAEELDLVWDSVPEIQFWWRHYGQAIEAKLREKNT